MIPLKSQSHYWNKNKKTKLKKQKNGKTSIQTVINRSYYCFLHSLYFNFFSFFHDKAQKSSKSSDGPNELSQITSYHNDLKLFKKMIWES